MEKNTIKAKLEIFTFLRKSVESQGYSLDKISRNCAFDKISQNFALYRNSMDYTLTRVFLHAEFISVMKTVTKSYGFHENAKIIENHSFLLVVWDFHWNSWADCQKKSHRILFLDGKEDK